MYKFMLVVLLSVLMSGCYEDENFSIRWLNGSSCSLAYYASDGMGISYPEDENAGFFTINDASNDMWVVYTPSSNMLQIDNCGSTDLETTVEIYLQCDDVDTPDIDESIQLDITLEGCGVNYHTLIEDMDGGPLYIKFPAVPGTDWLFDDYPVYITEMGE